MAITVERLVGFVYRNPENHEIITMLPKTVAQQVEIEGRSGVTVWDHVSSNEHLTAKNKLALAKAGEPLGLCLLDENGYVSLDNMPDGMTYIKIEFADIPAMLAADNVNPGSICFVLDASADPTVDSGWAIYKRTSDADYTSLDKGWEKVCEHEALDLELTWEALKHILPQSSPEDIDDMVAKMHSHDGNLSVLNDITALPDGKHFAYKGEEVALRKDVSHWLFGDYYKDEEILDGDLWLKAVTGQLWWYNENIPNAGASCYQKYAQNSTLKVGPKVRTNSTTSFRRMFYQDYNLEEIPQYNFAYANDIGGFVQECSKLEQVPYMNTIRCHIFDYAFSGCSLLKFGPEISMVQATSAIGMYSGCPNMVRVYPFGTTHGVTSMKSMFNGDSSLEKIDTPIDFSSIATASAVAGMFNECIELSYLRVVPETLSVSLSVQGTNLDVDSLLSLFDGLVPYTGDPSDAPTLNILDVESASLLSADQRAIVTNKGWKLEYGVHTPVDYIIENPEDLSDAIATMLPGDTLTVSAALNSVGTPIVIDKHDIAIQMDNDITSDGGSNSGIAVENGSLTITGTAKVVNTTPYDRTHASGVIQVSEGGSLTFDGGGISAVIEDDPVNKGQFGVCGFSDAQITVNSGELTAGWYCLSGNGSLTNADAVTTVNGGTLTSTVDYAIYHPHKGKLVVNDGIIRGGAGAIAANDGVIEINGGKLSVLGNGDTGEGGDGTAGMAEAVINLNARYGDVTCTITGGTFDAPTGIPIFIIGTKHTVTLTITGGSFSARPNDEWIGEGYQVTESEGRFVVVPNA